MNPPALKGREDYNRRERCFECSDKRNDVRGTGKVVSVNEWTMSRSCSEKLYGSNFRGAIETWKAKNLYALILPSTQRKSSRQILPLKATLRVLGKVMSLNSISKPSLIERLSVV